MMGNGPMPEGRQVEPPEALKRLQEGFGESVRTPFSFATGKFAYQTHAYAAPTVSLVLPRGDQGPRERLSIYNEQYWFRLFTALQEDFPLLARSLGFWDFNRLVSAYLDTHPPRSPFLENLPDRFHDFIRGDAGHPSPLHHQIVALELALLKTFHAPATDPFQPEDMVSAAPRLGAETVLRFQSGFSLFEEDWNLMALRMGGLQATDAKPVPIACKGYWAVFRSEGRLDWKELERTPFLLLSALAAGSSIVDACGGIAGNLGEEDLKRLPIDLPRWFAEWTASGWFVPITTASA
jgi:hypothetical protein